MSRRPRHLPPFDDVREAFREHELLVFSAALALRVPLLFGWWAGSVANYKAAVGTLTAFLLLTTYALTSTTIFLAGAQLDELARKGGHR